MTINARTFMSRVVRDGYTVEQAAMIPKNTPRWMWIIEQAEGRAFREIMEEAARVGKTLTSLSIEYDVGFWTLWNWKKKWGIYFQRKG